MCVRRRDVELTCDRRRCDAARSGRKPALLRADAVGPRRLLGRRAAEKFGRHGHRDATLILIAYRHVLRVTELVSLRWDALDLAKGFLHFTR